MSLFVLVHGSTQSSSGWELLDAELRSRGQETTRVDLPADQPEWSATQYAAEIAQSFPAVRGDATVVAHSASGLFLPLVPFQRAVGGLVFLAAALPDIGRSFLDQVRDDSSILHPDWVGKDPTRDDDIALRFLFHDCSPEVARWALTTRRLMFAKQAIVEVSPLREWPKTRCSYIVCDGDRTFQPTWSRRVARERLGVDAITIPGGHCPHVSRPRELAEILLAISFR